MVQSLSLTRPRIVAVPLFQADMGQRQCEAAAAVYSQTRLHRIGGIVKVPSTGWHTASVCQERITFLTHMRQLLYCERQRLSSQ